MRQLRPFVGIMLSMVFLLFCFTPQVKTVLSLPENQTMVVGESSVINIDLPGLLDKSFDLRVLQPSQSVFAGSEDPAVVISKQPDGYEITALRPGKVDVRLNLLGYIPVKSITIESIPTRRVVLGGHSIGVMLRSRGIMVVGFAPINTGDSNKKYPAREQGVQIGDLILKVDNQVIKNENDLAKIIDEKKQASSILNIKRGNKILNIPVKAEFCTETQRYRIGLFVRDGVVGVGTLSFWEPETKTYAALGHIIVDADTRKGIDVLKGKIVSASIQTIKPGRPGHPGEKIGIFSEQSEIEGSISKNTYYGIYGKTKSEIRNPLREYTIEVGYAHQVKCGRADIYTVINNNDIERFTVEIEKVYPERATGKGMVIKVTDPRLLNISGGIIQGMSGSPIVQDGRIIGAITHVFLNDPQRGYGIFMDNMLSEIPVDDTA